jgi:hypothetical protein
LFWTTDGTEVPLCPGCNVIVILIDTLADEYIGLEEVGDGCWNIVYYETLLGRIDEKTGRITGVEG